MNDYKTPLLTVLISWFSFGLLGGLSGFAIGKFLPGYYRTIFSAGKDPGFDPAVMGLGQGLTQGMVAGIVVGIIIVAIVEFRKSRQAQKGAE